MKTKDDLESGRISVCDLFCLMIRRWRVSRYMTFFLFLLIRQNK